MATWTVRAALTRARTILLVRTTDPRLTPDEQAEMTTLSSRIDEAIAALRADDTVRANQRAAVANAMRDPAKQAARLEELRGISTADMYDPIDLIFSAAEVIEAGTTPFVSVLSDGL